MEKSELTKGESELYMKIVKNGTMNDMFDFAYAIGRERLAKEQLEMVYISSEPNLKPKKCEHHRIDTGNGAFCSTCKENEVN